MASSPVSDFKPSHARQNSTERSIARQRASTSHSELPLLEEDMSATFLISKVAKSTKDTALMLGAAVTQVVAPYDISVVESVK
ncbi:hypothetical protein FRB94_010504 [Tulasnella sp. JGI-2019a]|nr:hypothetical protein FRB93_008395 [Tulasnella sp. JGI-2019a]KAG8993636.1 hypothetical protein FRB94_010504 [Tulasnella sp. JGI-2019a]KAG9027982.1 hypothetical protein FRB95_006988 [Tulasnella sp. JGI-2019a]